MIEILRKYTKVVIYKSETATTVKQAVEEAVKNGASLDGAYLDGAYLDGAYLDRASLARASLNRASLNGASLDGAYLDGASLNGAKGINPNRCTPLRILLAQVGKIRAWKLVTKDGFGPYAAMNGYEPIRYEVGNEYERQANINENEQCGAGISLATLDWCMKEWRDGYRILLVEFDRADLACVPTATEGKFRVHRCRVVEEVDLASIGLTAEAAKPQEDGK